MVIDGSPVEKAHDFFAASQKTYQSFLIVLPESISYCEGQEIDRFDLPPFAQSLR